MWTRRSWSIGRLKGYFRPASPAAFNSVTRFSVKYAAPALAVFEPGCRIHFIQVALPAGSADIDLSTRYLDGWGSVQNPIFVEAHGVAHDPASATAALEETVSDFFSVLSLGA